MMMMMMMYDDVWSVRRRSRILHKRHRRRSVTRSVHWSCTMISPTITTCPG